MGAGSGGQSLAIRGKKSPLQAADEKPNCRPRIRRRTNKKKKPRYSEECFLTAIAEIPPYVKQECELRFRLD
jgi:hypothetical protein